VLPHPCEGVVVDDLAAGVEGEYVEQADACAVGDALHLLQEMGCVGTDGLEPAGRPGGDLLPGQPGGRSERFRVIGESGPDLRGDRLAVPAAALDWGPRHLDDGKGVFHREDSSGHRRAVMFISRTRDPGTEYTRA
jgi:hypothetical protein